MTRRTIANWLIVVAGVLAIIATFAVIRTRTLSVTVAPVEVDVPIQVFGLGTVEAQTLSKIGFETAGTLIELKADHGDTVKAGTLLARLQSREQEARVAQARAAVTQARAAVEQSQAAVEKAEVVVKQKAETNVRRQQLVQRGIVSQETAGDTQAAADVAKSDLSQAHSAVSVARANVEQAEAVRTLEEARLAKFTLYAPFDGVVMSRHKELGSALNANVWIVESGTLGPFAEASRIPGDTREMVARIDGVAEAGSITLQNVQVERGGRRVRLQVVGYEPGRPGGPVELLTGMGCMM